MWEMCLPLGSVFNKIDTREMGVILAVLGFD